MLTEHAAELAHTYWASHMGCAEEELFAEPMKIITHGGELSRYQGAFAMFRDGASMVSLPREGEGSLRPLVEGLGRSCTATDFAQALNGVATGVIGPACICYSQCVALATHPTRELRSCDAEHVDDLKSACERLEWEHGGSLITHPCSGVFVGGCLVALAGYEVWGGNVAHISIITHPGYRGHGYGRSAVAHVAARAMSRGLLPQYRTLQSNAPSMRVAESLGFHLFATSMAVRLDLSMLE